jgi:hypothetical protein
MNWLDGDHVVTPIEAFQQWRLYFLCVGPYRVYRVYNASPLVANLD